MCCSGDVANIDDRQSAKILRIRLTRNQAIIVRNKLRMHAGFFTEIDDLFQTVVVLQRKGHSDLIQFVFRQDKGQVIDGTQHLDSL